MEKEAERMVEYVHGYTDRESERLHDQADTLEELLHSDTRYPENSLVLEAGCGVGAQSVILGKNSPDARFVSLDISEESICRARVLAGASGLCNFSFVRSDLFSLSFPSESFDHVFLCFVLEHLADPSRALESLRRVLRIGGTITCIEGDHGSCYFQPETKNAVSAWRCLIDVQARLGGDALIGRRLYPLLKGAGFDRISVSPRMVYSDETRPMMMEGFVRRTIIPMVEGVKEEAVSRGMMDEASWNQGIADLHATARPPEGTFCYTFFKGTGIRSR
jgi:SAM-dependent methyltransferase